MYINYLFSYGLKLITAPMSNDASKIIIFFMWLLSILNS